MATHTEFTATTTGSEVVAAFADKVKGRVFLVTGPSPTSIGGATAIALAQGHPSTLVLVGRSPEKLGPVLDAISAADSAVKVVVVKIDLSSIDSVRVGADEILKNADVPRIDVAIYNAAIMAGPHERSADEIELQFATNHVGVLSDVRETTDLSVHRAQVGHWLMTNLLKPKLAPGKARIVNVASSAHRLPRDEDIDWLWERTPYHQWFAYGQAKLANVLFTRSLVTRGYEALALHPGSIWTGLAARVGGADADWSESQELLKGIENMEDIMPMKTIEQGCSTQLVAALDTALPNGAYLNHCQVTVASRLGQDVSGNLSEQLWQLSERLVGHKFD